MNKVLSADLFGIWKKLGCCKRRKKKPHLGGILWFFAGDFQVSHVPCAGRNNILYIRVSHVVILLCQPRIMQWLISPSPFSVPAAHTHTHVCTYSKAHGRRIYSTVLSYVFSSARMHTFFLYRSTILPIYKSVYSSDGRSSSNLLPSIKK